MGSEDADIDELGQVTIEGKKLTWKTNQKGAVGRMQVDEKLIALIKEIEDQLSVEVFGTELIAMLKSCYQKGSTVEQATFLFVNELFKDFGLVILLPDSKSLKTLFKQTIRKELTEQFSSKAVSKTIDAFPAEYKVQAGGRDLNLFYLNDHMRERIEAVAGKFVIANTDISFTSDEIMSELESFPERFSPNVITRPLYQETILPNVAFIGGGAELAYWLELKQVFKEAGLAFPVLVLRNSFMVLTMKTIDKIEALELSPKDFFEEQSRILGKLVAKRSTAKLSLENEKQKLTSLYSQIKDVSKAADTTLERHVEALCIQALHRITLLEKKLLKVEKRKFETEKRQISNIKTVLFPNSTLQERVDNILPYYAKYGPGFLRSIYDSSSGLDMRFCLLSVK